MDSLDGKRRQKCDGFLQWWFGNNKVYRKPRLGKNFLFFIILLNERMKLTLKSNHKVSTNTFLLML